MYRYLATSEEGFLQQLAVCYLKNHYWFYVTGTIPESKDPFVIDQKILDRYGIAMSKWGRYRRKKTGTANLQYLRLDRFFLILATPGRHHFFDQERDAIRDARESPIRFGDYAVSYRDGHSHVRINRETFEEMKAYFVAIAAKRPREVLAAEIEALRFERYAPVRGQLWELLRLVNRARRAAGLPTLPASCVRALRKPCRPFGHTEVEEAA
jgi:hypothetical protein